jgi:hypothetical protein
MYGCNRVGTLVCGEVYEVFSCMKDTVNHTICIVVYFVYCNCVNGTSWLSAGMITHKFNINFSSNTLLTIFGTKSYNVPSETSTLFRFWEISTY